MPNWPLFPPTSLVFPEKTTLSTLKFLNQDLLVTDKLMEVTSLLCLIEFRFARNFIF